MGTRALIDRPAGVDALRGSQSVRRALDLLLLVSTQDRGAGSTVSELASAGQLPKPTTRRLLQELTHAGFVDRDPESRRYFLGPNSFVIGSIAERRYGIQAVAAPVLARLAAETEDTVFLSVRWRNFAVCLHREAGTFVGGSSLLQAGDHHPLGVGAGSTAILASLPDPEVAEVLEQNRERFARLNPEFSTKLVLGDVEFAREHGFALNPGRVSPRSWAVGVAIRSADGSVHGALSIACIPHRLSPERQLQLAALLKVAASEVADRLGELPKRS